MKTEDPKLLKKLVLLAQIKFIYLIFMLKLQKILVAMMQEVLVYMILKTNV